MIQNFLETQTLLIQNKLLQNIQKVHINYPQLQQRLTNQALIALYIVIRKSEKSLKQKNVKITKQALAFKGCASSDNVKLF